MNLTFSNEEIAVLFTHLNLMKKSIRKGFKKSYKACWEEKYNDYLSVISALEVLIKDMDPEQEYFNVVLTEEQFVMLHSFINFYVVELNKKENSKDKLNHEVIKVMAILEGIQMKINVMAAS